MNVRQIEQFVKDKVQRDKIINSVIGDISQNYKNKKLQNK